MPVLVLDTKIENFIQINFNIEVKMQKICVNGEVPF